MTTFPIPLFSVLTRKNRLESISMKSSAREISDKNPESD